MNFSVQKKPKVENVEKLQVKSPKDVYNLEIIQEIKDAVQEHFIFVGLDNRNNIRVITMLGIGSSCGINIDSKDILRTALINACDKVILVHNHPSNSLVPSKHDIYLSNITNKFLKIFNVKMVDHIIVTENEYQSMEELKDIDRNYIDDKLDFVDKVLLLEENKRLKSNNTKRKDRDRDE